MREKVFKAWRRNKWEITYLKRERERAVGQRPRKNGYFLCVKKKIRIDREKVSPFNSRLRNRRRGRRNSFDFSLLFDLSFCNFEYTIPLNYIFLITVFYILSKLSIKLNHDRLKKSEWIYKIITKHLKHITN